METAVGVFRLTLELIGALSLLTTAALILLVCRFWNDTKETSAPRSPSSPNWPVRHCHPFPKVLVKQQLDYLLAKQNVEAL